MYFGINGMASSSALTALTALKAAGNTHYSAREFDLAVAAYSRAAQHLPAAFFDEDEPPPAILSATLISLRQQGAVVYANRAAAQMGLNKAVAALADAQRACDLDPSYWKAHWRCGLSLMMMGVRLERSEQAIAAFQRALRCDGLPPAERGNVQRALEAAEYRLREGRDALDMPDMSSCTVS
jgi:tetratricopeptide (TPR) repeat protein